MAQQVAEEAWELEVQSTFMLMQVLRSTAALLKSTERRAETVRIILILTRAVAVVAYTATAVFRGKVAPTTEEVAGAAPAVMEELVEWALITLAEAEEEGVAAELLLMVVQQVNSRRMVATDVVVMVEISH